MISWTHGELPRPTEDRQRAFQDLEEFGYCLIANALSAEETQAMRNRLVDQAAAERKAGLAFEDGGKGQQFVDEEGRIKVGAFSAANGGINQRVWMLINKGEVFRGLVTHPIVDQFVGGKLGPEFLLSNFSANIAKPGGVEMGLHTDQWWMPTGYRPGTDDPTPVGAITRQPKDPDDGSRDRPETGVMPCAVVNTMWMLADFTEANGGTRVVPRSHLSGRQPDGSVPSPIESVAAEGPSGTCLVFDGRTWHGTGANSANDERIGILVTFCGPQFRPQANFTVATDRRVVEEASDKLKARLGFKVWNAYGRVESPAVEFIDPGQNIPEMHVDKA